MMWPFKRKHKHKWEFIRRQNLKHYMVWTIRECSCGVQEIFHGGIGGDKKWHPLSEGFRFDWEGEWFEEGATIPRILWNSL